MSYTKNVLEKGEVAIKLQLVNGRIAVVTTYEGKIGGVDMTTYLKGDALIDFLEELIPGNFDTIPLEFAREKLKTL